MAQPTDIQTELDQAIREQAAAEIASSSPTTKKDNDEAEEEEGKQEEPDEEPDSIAKIGNTNNNNNNSARILEDVVMNTSNRISTSLRQVKMTVQDALEKNNIYMPFFTKPTQRQRWEDIQVSLSVCLVCLSVCCCCFFKSLQIKIH